MSGRIYKSRKNSSKSRSGSNHNNDGRRVCKNETKITFYVGIRNYFLKLGNLNI